MNSSIRMFWRTSQLIVLLARHAPSLDLWLVPLESAAIGSERMIRALSGTEFRISLSARPTQVCRELTDRSRWRANPVPGHRDSIFASLNLLLLGHAMSTSQTM
jgi:hypothetical protein